MPGTNLSQRKGAAYERALARRLSLWISNGKDALIFNRRGGSGGALRHKTAGGDYGGDIFADKPAGFWLTDKIVFELKHYKNLQSDLWRFMALRKGKICDFIAQAAEAAEVHGKFWALIIRSNRLPDMIFTNFLFLGEKAKSFGIVSYRDKDIAVIGLDDFFTRKPQTLKTLIKLQKESVK